MDTYAPDKLLSLWTLEQLDLPMAMGHVLQNLVIQHKAEMTIKAIQSQLSHKIDSQQTEIAKLKGRLEQLQVVVDRLTASLEKPVRSRQATASN